MRQNLRQGWEIEDHSLGSCTVWIPVSPQQHCPRIKAQPSAWVLSIHWAPWEKASPRKRAKLYSKRPLAWQRREIRARAPGAEGEDNSLFPHFPASGLTREPPVPYDVDSHQQDGNMVPMCGDDVQERRQHSGVKEHLGKLSPSVAQPDQWV